jgi:hypothetical protein
MPTKFTIGVNAKSETYTVEKKVYQGKNYMIVPVTMMVEGVHSGSHGPLLHLINEIGKFPNAWDGVPLVITHPQNELGVYVSANSPEVLEQYAVGKVFGTEVKGKKLVAQAWFQEESLQKVSPDVYSGLENNQVIEVSVGSFVEEEDEQGEFDGVQYNAIARNHRPDHLAILPGETGACSVSKGCGIRANQQKGGLIVDLSTKIRDLKDLGYRVGVIQDNSDKGLNERLDQLRDLVRSLNPPSNLQPNGPYIYNYLIEAYDGYVVYEEEGSGHPCKYYKRNYQFSAADGAAEFTGDPVEVKKTIEYKTVTVNGKITRTKFNINKEVPIMECTPCVKKKVDALIANTQSGFVECDRTMLEALKEEQLDKLVPKTIEVNKEVVKEINVLSAEDKNALEFGKRQLKERRDSMIAGIQANVAKDIWTPEVLSAMDDSTLEKLHKSVVKDAPVDYSLNGNSTRHIDVNAGQEEALYPVGMEVK